MLSACLQAVCTKVCNTHGQHRVSDNSRRTRSQLDSRRGSCPAELHLASVKDQFLVDTAYHAQTDADPHSLCLRGCNSAINQLHCQ